MIHLMLYADREQFLGINREWVPLAINGFDGDRKKSIDRFIKPGNRKTTFVGFNFTLSGHNLWINENQRIGLVLGYIDHYQSFVNIDLTRRKPYPRERRTWFLADRRLIELFGQSTSCTAFALVRNLASGNSKISNNAIPFSHIPLMGEQTFATKITIMLNVRRFYLNCPKTFRLSRSKKKDTESRTGQPVIVLFLAMGFAP